MPRHFNDLSSAGSSCDRGPGWGWATVLPACRALWFARPFRGICGSGAGWAICTLPLALGVACGTCCDCAFVLGLKNASAPINAGSTSQRGNETTVSSRMTEEDTAKEWPCGMETDLSYVRSAHAEGRKTGTPLSRKNDPDQ